MLHTNIGNGLPHQFIQVGSIRSIELRTTITNIISSLSGLISETKEFEPDPKTKETVDRFYQFLRESCKSPATINKRGLWLSTYGQVALNRMMDYRNKHITFSSGEVNHDHDELFGGISKMVAVIRDYHVAYPQAMQDEEHLIMETLDQIVDLVRDMKPNQKKHYYSTISRDVDRITGFMSTALNLRSSRDGRPVLDALVRLRYKIRNYSSQYLLMN